MTKTVPECPVAALADEAKRLIDAYDALETAHGEAQARERQIPSDSGARRAARLALCEGDRRKIRTQREDDLSARATDGKTGWAHLAY